MIASSWRRWAPWLLFGMAVMHLVMVWLLRDPAMINPDSAQLVTAARNMLDGNGFATSALYYEQQHRLGDPPVPLTNWPPGFALTMLPFVAIGLTGPDAAFLVSAIGMAVAVVLTYVVGAAVGLRTSYALLTGGAMALLAHFGLLVVKSMSEPLFVAATLASALFLLRAEASRRPVSVLAMAGALAACAFLTRYAGLAWIAAGLAMILAMHWRAGWRPVLARFAAFGILPAVVLGALFARNLLTVGSLTGGPALGGDTSLRAVLQSDYWAALRVFGAFNSAGEPVVALLLGCLAAFGGYRTATIAVGRRMVDARTSPPHTMDHFVVLATAYTSFTLLLLGYLSFTVYPGFAEQRYLVPVVPFGLLLGAVLLQGREGSGGPPRPSVRSTRLLFFAAIVAVYVLGQVRVATHDWAARMTHPQLALMKDVWRESVAGETVAAYLKRRVTLRAPLLADDGQVLAALLGIPTVGLPERRFSRKVWNEQDVEELMRALRSCLLLVHPASLGPPKGDWPVFLGQLAKGAQPEWLDAIVRSPRLHLYRARWCEETR